MGIALCYYPPTSSPLYETLKSLIMSLQTLFPDSVSFEPHLTITSQLRCEDQEQVTAILTAAVAAVKSIKPQLEASDSSMVTFDSVKVGKKYFQKVRLCCSQNKYLYGIAQIIRELFVLESHDPAAAKEWVLTSFAPHVSLVYSDLYHVDQALLRSVQQRIEDALSTVLVSETVQDVENQFSWLIQQPISGWSIPGTFKVVRCEGPVHEWEVLGSVDV
ncbi:HDL433Cp [Eremothecium sinecaudum]|uniref:2',3'-cyclic-nucleotide 3'-phosphodiesterase n=1 Tax=Eremothecium sinecaudum TaxID=45286 RepID=A0A109UWU3_9SACH|nr:HDL433Cp [Eremothecium sinecaudum]AMD20311.1 HDL433Cp [Eremothecium sinecaudum]